MDNGKEFCNIKLETYCKKNEINFIHGRPYHPQSQDCVESFNKEIKRILENIYLEEPNAFSIYDALPEAVQIYNNNRHSSTKYRPNDIFFINDDIILKKVIKNIKNSQKKFKNSSNSIPVNSNCLLCENFELKNKIIKEKKIKKKVNTYYHVLLLELKDQMNI